MAGAGAVPGLREEEDGEGKGEEAGPVGQGGAVAEGARSHGVGQEAAGGGSDPAAQEEGNGAGSEHAAGTAGAGAADVDEPNDGAA